MNISLQPPARPENCFTDWMHYVKLCNYGCEIHSVAGTAVFFWLFMFKMKLNQILVTFTVFARFFLNLKHHAHSGALIDLELAPNDDAFSNNGRRSILGDKVLINFHFEDK